MGYVRHALEVMSMAILLDDPVAGAILVSSSIWHAFSAKGFWTGWASRCCYLPFMCS